MELTQEQKFVLQQIVTGVRKGTKKVFTLAGYAGTGKSFLASFITKFFADFCVAAYTGKAANVLREKNVEAHTIHSSIYAPVYEWGKLLGFDLKSKAELGYNGFIIDEASMCPQEIHQDLVSYNYPIIYIGDHGQLEPIGTDFNLMKNPDFKLETIHRNANDIAKFAERIRNGYRATSFPLSDKVFLKQQRNLTEADYLEVDQVVCAYNKTRVEINKQIRAFKGYTGSLKVGERVICLKNNRSLGLFNGMQGVVKNLYVDEVKKELMDLEVNGVLYQNIWYDSKHFNVEKPEFDYDTKEYPNPFDFAYACTCHKVQGSEYNKVLVIEQRCNKWDHTRWSYTGASRAREKLIWAY